MVLVVLPGVIATEIPLAAPVTVSVVLVAETAMETLREERLMVLVALRGVITTGIPLAAQAMALETHGAGRA